MGNKQFIVVLSLVCLVLTACISHQQLQDQNKVLNTELKHARIELYEAEEKLKKHQDFIVCQQKIGQLDIKYQEVITLRFFEQKRIKEIGEILGKSDGTIKSLLHRGLEKLRVAMNEYSQTQPFSRSSIIDSERSTK